jgi:hypothetical protein
MEFLWNNIGLVLGIVGAAATLVVSLTRTVQEKPSRRMVASLFILGFVTFVGQQLIKSSVDALSARQRQEAEHQRQVAEKNRDMILAAIRGTVVHTASVVEDISRRLAGASLADVGDPLVAVNPAAGEVEEILSFGKGPISAWKGYALWVGASRNVPGRRFLTFDVNASRHYAAGLSLAYLLTAPETAVQLQPVVAEGASGPWFKDPFVDRLLLDWKGVDYVLFRDSGTRRVLAYAPARAFASELLLRLRVGEAARVEEILNRRQESAGEALAQFFPSVRTSVYEGADVASVVRIMLERKWPECVAGSSEGRFVVALEKVVRAAEAGGGRT